MNAISRFQIVNGSKLQKKYLKQRDKGVNQPLVLMDQAALIVSAKNAHRHYGNRSYRSKTAIIYKY